MTYRTRTFLVVLLSSVVALGVAVGLMSSRVRRAMLDEIEARLVHQARLAAALLAERAAIDAPDAEADALGRLTEARVTLIDASGRVIGDSAVPPDGLATLDNHASRPEVRAALEAGRGVATRLSRTTGVDTMYAATPASAGPIAVVRVALPITVVDEQLAHVRRLAAVGLGAGLTVALALTWVVSIVLSRRIRSIAQVAERYRQGDFRPSARGFGRDEIGRVAGALDSTARELGRQLADASRDRAHTEAILAGMREGVVLVDRNGRLVLTNQAVRSMLRLPDPWEDRPYPEVVREPGITGQLARALSGAPTTPVEVPLEGTERRTYVANVEAVPPSRGGGAVLVLHDITDIKRADQMRRDFVANVSHELRTPLTAVRGSVEALQDGVPPDQTEQFLQIITRHTLRMERLVRDLLRLARLDAGQEPLELATCALPAALASVRQEMQTQLAERRQTLTTDVAPEAGQVTADPAKLHDVLRNLVENASTYGPEDSAIDVVARRREATIEVTVSDRGPGIPASSLPRIFERFYRVDQSRARHPGGTGLGLSIVRQLVQLHGGEVGARGRDGGGTEVWFRLPSPQESVGPDGPAAAGHPG